MRIAAIVVAALLLTGCWQSTGSLYPDRPSLYPFREGVVEQRSRANPKALGRDRLTRTADGYRIANDNAKDSDFGEYSNVRFFALPGAPTDVLVFEETDPCKATDKKCTPQNAQRNYGLVRVTRQGAAAINPECAKHDPLGKRPGVSADGFGSCDFSSRAELERALRALARTSWKPDLTYRYVGLSR